MIDSIEVVSARTRTRRHLAGTRAVPALRASGRPAAAAGGSGRAPYRPSGTERSCRAAKNSIAGSTGHHGRSPGEMGRAWYASAALLLVAVLTLTTGCAGPVACVAPASRREALDRVNANIAKLQQPLSCSALVSFRLRDADGRAHAFIGHEARLIYQPPQSLFFDVRAALGASVARFGSNADTYWLWIDVPEARKMWWGRWRPDDPSAVRKLPVPPDELLDALMLRPLPEALEGGQLPLLRVEGSDHRLVYVRRGPGGQPTAWREIRLDPCEPYLPREIIDRLPDGQIAMHAQLDHYRRVGADGPITPRRYVVRWPTSEAEMRLDILTARVRPDLPAGVFDFPADWQGETEALDGRAPEAGAP